MLAACVDLHQPNGAARLALCLPPGCWERRLGPTSLRGNSGKCQYSQENHISGEDAAGPSGCCIEHGHERGVCAQALGVFLRAGATPDGLVVGSASSVDAARVPPRMQGQKQGLCLWRHLSSATAPCAGGDDGDGREGSRGGKAHYLSFLEIREDEVCNPDQSWENWGCLVQRCWAAR